MHLVKHFIQCSGVLGICLLCACSNSESQKTTTSSAETTIKADNVAIKSNGENVNIQVDNGSDTNKIDVQINDKTVKVDTPLVKVNVDEQNDKDNDDDDKDNDDKDNDEPNENTQVALGQQGIKVNTNDANVKIGADELKIDTGDVSIDLNGKDGLKISTK